MATTAIDRDRWRPLALLLIGLAAAWRLLDLDARCLWFDEAFSWQLTRFPWAEMIDRARMDVHPPLYYVGLKLWTGAFGDSVFAMRLLSVAWFCVALAGAYLLCGEVDRGRAVDGTTMGGSGEPGLVSMLFLASSPFLFRYSQEARMYTQMAALTLLSTWLLLRAMRERLRPAWWWTAYGVSAAALAYTHNFGLFTLAAQGCLAAGSLLVSSRERGLRPWRDPTARWALATAALTVALYLPWVPTLLAQQAQVSRDYWAQSVNAHPPTELAYWRDTALSCLLHNRANLAAPFRWDLAGETPLGDALLLAVGLGLGVLAWRRGSGGWCLLVGVVVPIELAILASIEVNRNIIGYRYLTPSFVLTLVGLACVIGLARPRLVRLALAGAAFGGMIYLTYQHQASLGLPERAEFRRAADHIAEGRRPGDFVVCANPTDFFPMKYHARGRFDVRQARYPGMVVRHYTGGPIYQEGDFLPWPKALGRKDRRVWVVTRDSDRPSLDRPGRYVHVETVRFPEAFRWRGDVSVHLWEPARPPIASSTVGDAHEVPRSSDSAPAKD